jgi:hypothetical protein
MTLVNPKYAEEQLREKLATGKSLGDALRALRGSKGIDLLSLCHAVEIVCELPSREAKKVVVKETSERN